MNHLMWKSQTLCPSAVKFELCFCGNSMEYYKIKVQQALNLQTSVHLNDVRASSHWKQYEPYTVS